MQQIADDKLPMYPVTQFWPGHTFFGVSKLKISEISDLNLH